MVGFLPIATIIILTIGAIAVAYFIYDAPASEKRYQEKLKEIEASYFYKNVTIEKKFTEGKNVLLQDLHFGLGTKGELFHLDGLDYNIIDVGKSYIFKCRTYEWTGDSCYLQR